MPKAENKRILLLPVLSDTKLNISKQKIDTLLDNLVEQGWYEWPNAIPDRLCENLLAEIETYAELGDLQRAGIGQGEQHQLNNSVRRDEIKWLNGRSDSQLHYFEVMQILQTEMNRALFLGLFEYECHYALYPQGGFYKIHRDSFKGQANRMVTTVLYLNPGWQTDWGGELVLYNDEQTKQIARISPELGKMVIFMSEQIPHEVLPTQQPRASIAGWFRLNTTTAGVIDPPR